MSVARRLGRSLQLVALSSLLVLPVVGHAGQAPAATTVPAERSLRTALERMTAEFRKQSPDMATLSGLIARSYSHTNGETGEVWDRDAWIAALDANMLAPLAVIRAVLPGMVERRFGRIVNITSAMVKTPVSPMGLSTGARAGLTTVAKALSKDVAKANVTINNLLPERFDTPRQRQMAERMTQREGISLDEARRRIAQTIAARRMGRPEEFGDACAFLCSAQAGFISGQNLQLDGGSYPGLI